MSQLSGVEVRTSSGAWQPGASIINYNPDGEIITVGFQEDFNRTQEVPIGDVRFAAVTQEAPEAGFADGDDVELLWKNKGDTPTQWYPGKVRNVKGGFYVVEFVHFGQPVSDVFEEKSLRLPNTNPCLSGTDFYKAEVEIPEDLHEFCNTHSDAHRDFQKACEAMTIQYLNGRLIILSRKDVSRRVDMIKEFHIKNLLQKRHIADKLTNAQGMLEKSKLVAESCCEKFKVDGELLKFVVGTKGTNIGKARAIPGVIHISIDDENQMVCIYADTSEAAKTSRLLLEFTEEHYLVPRNLVGRIIGQKGKSIQDIIDKSHVLKVRVLSEEDAKAIPGADDPNVCAFKFIGTRTNNQNAKALMDYLVQSLKEIDDLQAEEKQVNTEIASYKIPYTSYSINGNGHHGNSSGYSSDNRNGDTSYKYRRNNRRDGENGNTDSETETNRNGRGNYRNRNQKPRDNRIEEHKRLDNIDQIDVSEQQSKPKTNQFQMLGDVNTEQIAAQGITFQGPAQGDDWSEVQGQQAKKEFSSGDVKGQYARAAASVKTGSGDKNNA